jgi:carboxypeptidase Q
MKKLLLVFLLSPLFSVAQNEDSLFIKKIADQILTGGYAYDKLRELCKQVGPRLTGSQQMYKAEAWGIANFNKFNGVQVIAQECKIKRWVRGGADKAVATIAGKKMNLDITALGNSMGAGAKGVSAPVILINSFDELEKRKSEIKGKIVFYNAKFDNTLVETFYAYGATGRYRWMGPSRAAKYGAVGVVIRSMTHATDNHPHTGSMGYNDSFPKIPAAAMGLADADKLESAFTNNKPVSIQLNTYGHYISDSIGHNIIAEWKGSEHPEQIITIGGHLDSWDLAEGAHDDGAGCVQSMQVLQTLYSLGYQPKHTIRIVLFCNEENGGAGGDKYLEEAKVKNEKHLFALESDEGGFTPRGFTINDNGVTLKKLQSYIPLLNRYGVFSIEQGGDGADIEGLKDIGAITCGFKPDSQRYFDMHHARSDVFENVNKRELLLGAVNMTALIYLVDKYGL